MLKEYREELVSLGLTDKESKVYLSLLAMGKATAERIAKDTKLNRSTTYVQLKQLLDQGLVSTFKEGKKTLFASESPNNLGRLLERQLLELEKRRSQAASVIPDLLNVYTTVGNRPVIRIFEGKDGLTSLRNEVLKTKKKEFCAASSIDEMQKIFSVKELQAFSHERSRRGIKSYLLYTFTEGEISSMPPQELRRLSREEYPFSADMYIFDDKVAFATTKGQIVGVIIESQTLAESMYTLYMLAWEQASAISTQDDKK